MPMLVACSGMSRPAPIERIADKAPLETHLVLRARQAITEHGRPTQSRPGAVKDYRAAGKEDGAATELTRVR